MYVGSANVSPDDAARDIRNHMGGLAKVSRSEGNCSRQRNCSAKDGRVSVTVVTVGVRRVPWGKIE
jgi:hypothetical protein